MADERALTMEEAKMKVRFFIWYKDSADAINREFRHMLLMVGQLRGDSWKTKIGGLFMLYLSTGYLD